MRVQQEAREDAVTSWFSSHPSVVFSLQPDLLTPGQVDRQAARRHLESDVDVHGRDESCLFFVLNRTKEIFELVGTVVCCTCLLLRR